jgi:hypothetical protein
MERVMTSSLERLAQNQSLFREINERVKEIAEPEEPIRYVCECSHVGCEATIELSGTEYELVRSEPTHFVVAGGHQLPEIEQVVAAHDGYFVVEKVIGREFSQATDPRSDA